jgi:rubrerythrin
MACRRAVTARQMRAAQMLLEGKSAFRALIEAGYSRWTARTFGKLLRGSWGLREAIRLRLEQTGQYLLARPVRRRKKYDRRPLALNVRQYVATDLQAATTNTFLHKLHADEKRAHAIAEGKHALPSRCSVCRGLTEGNDHWCPRCQQTEKR